MRQLPGGRLIVNDIQKRQLLMFDNTLANATVIADSVSGGANAYGPSAGGIIPYFGDSTLFVDPRDLSMFVIDPAGTIARVAAVPRSQDAGTLGSNMLGSPALDSKGRIVYRDRGIGRMTMPAGGGRGTGGPMMAGFAGLGGARPRRSDDAQDRHGGLLQDPEDQDEHDAVGEGHLDDIGDQPNARSSMTGR